MAKTRSKSYSSLMKRRTPNGTLDRVMSAAEFKAEADALARRVLHVPSVEAFRKLERGDLAGTAIEAELKMLRHLMRT